MYVTPLRASRSLSVDPGVGQGFPRYLVKQSIMWIFHGSPEHTNCDLE